MKQKNFLLLIGLLLPINSSYAILPHHGVGAPSSALGGTSVAKTGFWAQFNNQAGLANNKHFMLGTSYENRFLLKPLSVKTLGFLIPVNNGSFGFNIIHYGDALYNEMNLGLAFGRKLGKKLYAGLQFDYFTIHQSADYGTKQSLTFEGGFMYQVDEKIKIGGHVYNPFLKTKINEISLPEIYRFGFEYAIEKDLLAYVEFVNNSLLNNSTHWGLEYLKNAFILRMGYASNPDQFSFGFGFHKNKLTIDISSVLHAVLGITPQLSMTYQF